MDKIVLKDGTEYEILEGASIGRINMEVEEFSKIEEITNKFTKENLKDVKFKVNDNVTGEYKNLVLENISFVSKDVVTEDSNKEETSNSEGTSENNTSETSDTSTGESSSTTNSEETNSDSVKETTKTIYVATISLRESSELELRLLALEEKTDTLNANQEVTNSTVNDIITDIIPSLMSSNTETVE